MAEDRTEPDKAASISTWDACEKSDLWDPWRPSESESFQGEVLETAFQPAAWEQLIHSNSDNQWLSASEKEVAGRWGAVSRTCSGQRIHKGEIVDPSLRTWGDNRWGGSDEQFRRWGTWNPDSKPQSHIGIMCVVCWDHCQKVSVGKWENIRLDVWLSISQMHPPLSIPTASSLVQGTIIPSPAWTKATASSMVSLVPRLPSTLYHPHRSQWDLLKIQSKPTKQWPALIHHYHQLNFPNPHSQNKIQSP